MFAVLFLMFACCRYPSEELVVQKLNEARGVADYPPKLAKLVERCFLFCSPMLTPLWGKICLFRNHAVSHEAFEALSLHSPLCFCLLQPIQISCKVCVQYSCPVSWLDIDINPLYFPKEHPVESLPFRSRVLRLKTLSDIFTDVIRAGVLAVWHGFPRRFPCSSYPGFFPSHTCLQTFPRAELFLTSPTYCTTILRPSLFFHYYVLTASLDYPETSTFCMHIFKIQCWYVYQSFSLCCRK